MIHHPFPCTTYPLLVIFLIIQTNAFTYPKLKGNDPSSILYRVDQRLRCGTHHQPLKLATQQSYHEDDADSMHRALIKGVSISPFGFLVLLMTTLDDQKKVIIPIRVTSDPEDAYTAASPESLTICQLLSGVDMAGAMLKPSILNELVALSCSLLENQSETSCIHVEDELGLADDTRPNTRAWVNQMIAKTLPHTSYATANPWERNKVVFPAITLVGVDIQLPMDDDLHSQVQGNALPLKYNLQCVVNSNQPWVVPLYSEINTLSSHKSLESELVYNELILRQCLYAFDTSSSAAYLALSLALRYDAPISISSKVIAAFLRTNNTTIGGSESELTSETISDDRGQDYRISILFPKWKSRSSARTLTQRTLKDIEQGFQIKKLLRALNVAKNKGDTLAAAKIELEIRRLRDVYMNSDALKDGDFD